MAMTGDPILSEEEEDLGIVSRLTEKGGAVDTAIELAQRIAQNAQLGVAASKRLIRSSVGLTEAEFWALQRPIQAEVFTSHDVVEGPAAFAEKRPPRWTGT